MTTSAKKYLVIIEPSRTGYGAYVPDLPGCVASGDTLERVEQNIREGIAFHLEGLAEDGLPIPPPTSQPLLLEVLA